MVNANTILGLVSLGGAVAGLAWSALSHSPRIARLEAEAETVYVHDTTPAEREAIDAFLHQIAPEVSAAAKGDAAAAEQAALHRASSFAASLGYTIPAASILGGVQQGAREGLFSAAVQAADAVFGAAAPAAAKEARAAWTAPYPDAPEALVLRPEHLS